MELLYAREMINLQVEHIVRPDPFHFHQLGRTKDDNEPESGEMCLSRVEPTKELRLNSLNGALAQLRHKADKSFSNMSI